MNNWELIETGCSLLARGAVLLAGCWIASFALHRSRGHICSRLWQAGLAGLVGLSILVCLPPLWSVKLGSLKTNANVRRAPAASLPLNVEQAGAGASFETAGETVVNSLPIPPQSISPEVAMEPMVESATRAEPFQAIGASLPASASAKTFASKWIFFAWFAGALIVLLRWGTAIMRLRRFMRRSTPAGEPWVTALKNCSQELELRRKVRVVTHPDLAAPCISGMVHPTIAIPAEGEDWSDTKKKAILLHELSHLLRHDLLFQWIAVAAKAVHWLNPLVWVGTRSLRDSAERAADEFVIRHGIEPTDYADILYQFALPPSHRRIADFGLCMAEAESKMKVRIERLLMLRNAAGTGTERPIVTTALATACLSVAVILGTTAIGQDVVVRDLAIDSASPNDHHAMNPHIAGTALVEAKLRAFVIPEVNFVNTSLREALAFFREQTIILEKQDSGGSAVNFIRKCDDPKDLRIELKLKNVPAWDALHYVAEIANADIDIEPYGVVLLPAAKGDEIRSRTFMIDEEIYQEQLKILGISDAKTWLQHCGVGFPDRSGALFVPNPGRILVRTTPWNLKIVGKVIHSVSGESVASAGAVANNHAKLKQIILPEVRFSGASIGDVLDFIRTESARLDGATSDSEMKGIQLVNTSTSSLPVTMSLTHVPLEIAVRASADLAGIEYTIEPHAIVFRPRDANELQLRSFSVPLEVAEALMNPALATLLAIHTKSDGDAFAGASSAGVEPTYSGGELWQTILDSYGIPATDGSMAFWNQKTGELIVARRPSDMKDVESLIKQLGGTEM